MTYFIWFFFYQKCNSVEFHTCKFPHHRVDATQNIINAKGCHIESPYYRISNKYTRKLCIYCFYLLYKENVMLDKAKKYNFDEVIHAPTNHLREVLKKYIVWHQIIIVFIPCDLFECIAKYIMYDILMFLKNLHNIVF